MRSYLLAFLIMLVALSASGQLPQAPQPQRKMWDYKVAWSAWAVSMTADGVLSHEWAGRGPHPCAVEGNPSFANKNGTFRTGKYFTENALIGGGLFAVNLVIRTKAPVNIANHWAIRALGDFYPVYRTQEHTRNVVSWVGFCH